MILRHRELPGARAPVTASENPSRVLFKGLVAIGRTDLAGKCPPAHLLLRAAPGAESELHSPAGMQQGPPRLLRPRRCGAGSEPFRLMVLALPPPGTQTEPWATHSTSWLQSPHLCHEGDPDDPYHFHSPNATEATISSYPAVYTTLICFFLQFGVAWEQPAGLFFTNIKTYGPKLA